MSPTNPTRRVTSNSPGVLYSDRLSPAVEVEALQAHYRYEHTHVPLSDANLPNVVPVFPVPPPVSATTSPVSRRSRPSTELRAPCATLNSMECFFRLVSRSESNSMSNPTQNSRVPRRTFLLAGLASLGVLTSASRGSGRCSYRRPSGDAGRQSIIRRPRRVKTPGRPGNSGFPTFRVTLLVRAPGAHERETS